jgi:hypothetical protein
MRFLYRIILTILGGYLLIKLGFLELALYVIITTGHVIMSLAKVNPTAPAVGVLLIIMMGGRSLSGEGKKK